MSLTSLTHIGPQTGVNVPSPMTQDARPILAGPIKDRPPGSISRNSLFSLPIDAAPQRLKGYNREWGGADAATQLQVITVILEMSSDMAAEDRAILLAIARLESGLNPDAAARTSSAAGVFQIIHANWQNLGNPNSDPFQAEDNIKAGLALYKANLKLLPPALAHQYSNLRACRIYALFHDGPSLAYGGERIAEQKLIPLLNHTRKLVGAPTMGGNA